MVNKLLIITLLLAFATPIEPAKATTNICQEIAAELYLAADDLSIPPDAIKEIIERCEDSDLG